MRPPRLSVAVSCVVLAAATALAQEPGPAEQAVLDAEALRAEQMKGVNRATARTQVSVFAGDLGVHDADGRPVRPVSPRVEIAPPRDPGDPAASMPWLLPSIAGAVIAAILWARRPRRPRWSSLPGHQGLSNRR